MRFAALLLTVILFSSSCTDTPGVKKGKEHSLAIDSLAYDVGYYLIRAKEEVAEEFPEGGSVGKFVTVLGLQEDGSWRFLLDEYSPAPFEAFGHASDVRR